jgi:hypothetical protein
VEEFSGADGFAGEIGVSYVEAVREAGLFTIGIFGQSGFTWRQGPVFQQLNPSAWQR